MKRTIITAVVACLLGAATVGAVGSAATSKKKSATPRQSSTTPSKPTPPSGPPPTMKDQLAKETAARDALLDKVAKALSISTDDLKTAMKGVRDDALAQAVTDKKLTQDESDAIKACADAPLTCDRSNLPAFGGFDRGFGGFGFGGGFFGGKGDDYVTALAKKLGKSADDVKKAFQDAMPKAPAGRGGFGPGGRGPGGHGWGGPGGGHGPGPGGPGGKPGAGAPPAGAGTYPGGSTY